MSTEAQILANRRNALNSTGPRTPEGKSRSSANATKHGLSSGFRVYTNENQDDFEELIAVFTRTFVPTNAYEDILVMEMAQSHWRLARARRLEAGAVDDMAAGRASSDHDASLRATIADNQARAFVVFQRYAAAAERSGYRAYKQLLAIRKMEADNARPAAVPNEPNSRPAAPHRPAAPLPPFTPYLPLPPAGETNPIQPVPHASPHPGV